MAANIAWTEKDREVQTGHLLCALAVVDGTAKEILKNNNIREEDMRQIYERCFEEMKKNKKNHASEMPFTPVLQKILQDAETLARYQKQEVGTEHLLMALAKQRETTAGEIIAGMQGNPKKIYMDAAEMAQMDSEFAKTDFMSAKEKEERGRSLTPCLDKFSRDLVQEALDGKLDPVFNRENEIDSVMEILGRRTKNNPCILGEPGVGKTAIVEGLAGRIANNAVPASLKNIRVLSLDVSGMVAGTKYRGQFEERIKRCLRETIDAGNIILFIDELHMIIGAGGAEGAMDAANILKPALARGDLRAIGATTLNEYQKYFEQDKALERRFQKVMIDEPDVMSAISIMRGLKEKYENHHKVRITDDAIIASVELSHRYISDRFLPDKAIDLVDEAAAKLRLEMNSVPEEIDELDRKIQQLEIEKEALKREGTSKKLSDIQKELADLNDERTKLRAQWESERSLIDEIQKNKDAIEQYKFEASRAEREGDYGKVAELRYGKIKEAEQRIEVVKKKLADMKHGESLIREEVTSDDIAAVVSKWTGIPVNRMMQSERTKLLHLEEELHKRVVGQEVAIAALADAVRRNRAGLQDARRPIGSFIFLGTTGVGKTELAKALAEFLFDDETQMTRIDMSEYQEKHSVSRLIGAPPGYIGYDEGGQLTEAVRRKPYSVVLLDEIEKAHPDVFNILLQVLDDGRLTDNKGRTVDFKNTIVIMTSNIGAHIIQERLKDLNEKNRDQVLETTNNEVYELLKQTIRPEFLNRIDEVIMFTPLQKNEIVDIVRLQVKSLQKMLANNSITIEVTDKAVEWIAQEGYDPQFGARPVKRVIQRNLLNDLSKQILAEKITKDNQIVIDVKDDHIVFTNK